MMPGYINNSMNPEQRIAVTTEQIFPASLTLEPVLFGNGGGSIVAVWNVKQFITVYGDGANRSAWIYGWRIDK